MAVENEVVRAEGTEVISLLPEEIGTHEVIQALRSNRDSAKYQQSVEELSKSIGEVGQVQNGLGMEVDVEGGVEYQLIAGSRRRDAITLHNAGLGKSEVPMRMNLTILRGQDLIKALRKAIHENTQRENFSPMSLAKNIDVVRKLLKVEKDKDWSKKVAEYMGVSRAQVTEHFKLLSQDEEVQKNIEENGWSGAAALQMNTIAPEKQASVAAKAVEKAEEEAKKKAAKAPAPSTKIGKKADAKADSKPADKKAEGKGKAEPKKPEPKVQKKHVIAAAREAEALDKPKPLAKSELIDFFDGIDGPAYGHEDAPVRQFARYFVDKFAMGIGSAKTAMKKFDVCVLNAKQEPYAGIGTAKREEKPEPKSKAASAGKK